MSNIPSDRQILFCALCDAIDWQNSLGDSLRNGDKEQLQQSRALEMAYRAILKRRYGNAQTPMEQRLSGGKSISIYDLINTPIRHFDDPAHAPEKE